MEMRNGFRKNELRATFFSGTPIALVVAVALNSLHARLIAEENLPSDAWRLTAVQVPESQVAPGDLPIADIAKDVAEAPPREADLDSLLDMAEKDPSQLDSVQMQSASNSAATPSNSNIAETDFDPNQSASAAASASTGGLLSNAPSVITRRTSAVNQDVRIRGYSGSQIVGVANGMNQIKSRLDIDSLFSQLDPSLIDGIAVIAGPYSVQYGPGFAFFDATLIQPGRSSVPIFQSKSILGYNQNGQQFSTRETLTYATQRGGVIASIGQRAGNDYRAGSDFGSLRIPASYDVYDVFTSVSRDIGSHHRIDAWYVHQGMQNVELPGVVYDINDQNSDQINFRWTVKDDFGKDAWQNQFWWNQSTYNGDSSRSAKRSTFFDRLIGDAYPDLVTGNLVGRGLSDNWGARSQLFVGDRDESHGGIGLDWRRVRQLYQENSFLADGSPFFNNDTFGLPDSSIDDAGIFAHAESVVTDRLSIGAGQRLDWIRYSVDENDPVAAGPQSTPSGDFYPGLSEPSRTLSTTYLTSNYRLSETTRLNLGAAYAMRHANLSEAYSDQPYTPLVRFGNSFAFGDSNLAPEKNLQFDLGLIRKDDKSTYGFRLFHSSIRDYIGLASTNYTTFPEIGVNPPGSLNRGISAMADPLIPNPDITSDTAQISYAYRNIDRVTLYGADLLAERQFLPWFEVASSTSFTEGINHEPVLVDINSGLTTRLSSREGLSGIYPLNSGLTFRFFQPERRRWTFEWQSRFVRHQEYLATTLGEVGTPGFAVHNLHGTYQWTPNLKLRSSILNLFDRNYFEHNSLAIINREGNVTFVREPGFSFFSSLEYLF